MRSTVIVVLLLLVASLGCARSDDQAANGGPAAAAEAGAAGGSQAGEPAAMPPGEPTTPSAEASTADARPAGAAAPAGGPAAGSTTATPEGPAQGAQRDSAAGILERAADRYAQVRSLQADFTMSYENPLLKSRTTGAGKLHQQRPDRLLLRFSEPAGDVILSDGRWFWVYYPSVDATQVLRTAANPSASSGVDLQAQFLGDPTRRFSFTLDGAEAVGGREAWLLTLKPRERLGYRQLRVWIDQRDYLARRFEITEDNGSLRRFDLRNVRLDAALSDALFQFEVPPGAKVISR